MAGVIGLALLCLIGLVFVGLIGLGWGVVLFVAALAAALGALCGLTLRDTRERGVSVAHSLGAAARALLVALWY